eukprot:tig00000293_g23885.t1
MKIFMEAIKTVFMPQARGFISMQSRFAVGDAKSILVSSVYLIILFIFIFVGIAAFGVPGYITAGINCVLAGGAALVTNRSAQNSEVNNIDGGTLGRFAERATKVSEKIRAKIDGLFGSFNQLVDKAVGAKAFQLLQSNEIKIDEFANSDLEKFLPLLLAAMPSKEELFDLFKETAAKKNDRITGMGVEASAAADNSKHVVAQTQSV